MATHGNSFIYPQSDYGGAMGPSFLENSAFHARLSSGLQLEDGLYSLDETIRWTTSVFCVPSCMWELFLPLLAGKHNNYMSLTNHFPAHILFDFIRSYVHTQVYYLNLVLFSFFLYDLLEAFLPFYFVILDLFKTVNFQN